MCMCCVKVFYIVEIDFYYLSFEPTSLLVEFGIFNFVLRKISLNNNVFRIVNLLSIGKDACEPNLI